MCQALGWVLKIHWRTRVTRILLSQDSLSSGGDKIRKEANKYQIMACILKKQKKV